jgi:hypothetical protein
LLSVFFAAFNPHDYLYPGEENSSIEVKNISANGAFYSLVTIGGQEAFLLLDGKPVNDTGQVQSVLRASLHSEVSFDDKKTAITEGILKFNASRNKKIHPYSRYGVEDQCKLENVQNPCSTLSECIGTATMVCQIDPTVSCDAGLLGRAIYEFYPPSVQLSKDVSGALAEANSMTLDNAVGKLDAVKQKLPLIKSNAEKMSHSIIRYPAVSVGGTLWLASDPCNSNTYVNSHRDECGNIIGRCYPIPFDFSSLASAENAANTLSSSLAETESTTVVSQQITTATNDRIDFKVHSAIIAQYNAKLSAVNDKYPQIFAQVEKLRPILADDAFKSAVFKLDSKREAIELGISSKQYVGLDAKIAEYGKLALEANASMQNATEIYYAALKAQDASSDSLIEAEWAINAKDSGASSEFGKLKAKQVSLDSSFKPPLKSVQYVGLKADYNSLAKDAKSFTGNRARNILFSISGSAGKAGADSLLALASTVKPLDYKDRMKLAPSMPLWLLVLTGLSIVSLALAAFAGALVVFRGVFRQRLMMIVWVAALIAFFAVVGAGSAGAYVMLNQTSPGSTLAEFMSEVNSQGAAYVLVDTAGATDAAVASMDSCASKIAKSLREDGIKVSTYKVAGSKCFAEGKPTSKDADACLNSMSASGEPIFHLKYSATPKNPLFTLLVSKEAATSGDAAYMDKCIIQDAITNK